jgi:hypothetical protein
MRAEENFACHEAPRVAVYGINQLDPTFPDTDQWPDNDCV